MMKATVSYFALLLGVIMALAAGFAITYKKPDCPGVTPLNETIHFSQALYYSFLLSTTALVPEDKFFKTSYAPNITTLLYISGVIVVYLTLANLLIAVMTRRVNKLYDKIAFVKKIAKFSIVSLFDETVKCYSKMLKFRKCQKNQRIKDLSKYFKVSDDKKRFYLEVVETLATNQQIDHNDAMLDICEL